jgi:NADPH:quinone reductase-like Zn-dependent oxidoreductase
MAQDRTNAVDTFDSPVRAIDRATMTAITQERYGTSSVLQVGEIDRPSLADGQVLLRVHAAGVNPADWAIMSGLPYIARPVYGLRKPKNPIRGSDVAGTVEAVGPGVTRFTVGDQVFGWGDGTYAEYAAVDETGLTRKPANLTFEQAAAVPMAGLVALQAIRDHGKVGPGTRVLVNGASGGIGMFAVQIAKALGAHVTGVASTRNQDLVRSFGADAVIDYTKVDFTKTGERYDYILDNVSNHSLTALRRALTPTGMLVPNGGNFTNTWFAGGGRIMRAVILTRLVSQTLRNFLVSMKIEDLEALRELIEAGSVSPVIDRAFPLSQTAQALAHVGAGHARGKTVISMARA